MKQLPMSLVHFRERFRKWYGDVKIPKTNRFAQCDRCFNMKQKILLASILATKKIWRDALAKHIDDVRRDRAVY